MNRPSIRIRIALLALCALSATAWAKEVQVSIKAMDRMKYDVRRFEAGSGDQVRLQLQNTGKEPKHQSGYNLVILLPGTDSAAFAREAFKARDTDYIPASLKDRILAHTRLLGPGEQDQIAFTAPQPGEYPYLCSFPGHYTLMRGVMVVK